MDLAGLTKRIPGFMGVGKMVLMSCYGLAPPSWSGVEHDIQRDVAFLLLNGLGQQVSKLSAYGAMVSVNTNHSGKKIFSFNGLNWAPRNMATEPGIKKTYFWKEGAIKVKTVPVEAAPVVNDSLGLGNDDPDAMDVDG
jgi:hypothetical protein